MKKQRNWVPYLACGKTHKTPSSSSTCESCNEAFLEEKRLREIEEERLDRELRGRSYSTTEAIDALLEALLNSSDVLPIELMERVQDIQNRLDHDI